MTASLGGRAGLRPGLGFAAAALMLLPLTAGSHPLYDTTRVLAQEGNACLGQQGCKVIAAERRRVKAGKAIEIAARCPDARPFLVSWDAGHHEHIGLRLEERRPGGLSVVAINHADAPGRVTLYIGCATKRLARTVELRSLEAMPSKALKASPR